MALFLNKLLNYAFGLLVYHIAVKEPNCMIVYTKFHSQRQPYNTVCASLSNISLDVYEQTIALYRTLQQMS